MNKIILLLVIVFTVGCTKTSDLLEIAKKENFSVYTFQLKDTSIDTFAVSIKSEDGKSINFENCIRDSVYNLAGLLPNTEYTFEINYKNQSASQTHFTDSLPYSYMYKLDLLVKDISFEGQLLFHQSDSFGRNQVLLMNSDAEINWYGDFDLADGPLFFTKENTILALFGSDDILEFDLNGNTIFEAKRGTNQYERRLHHDIKKEGEKFVSLSTKVHQQIPSDIAFKYNIDTFRCDAINIFDDQMNIEWSWSMFDVASPFDENFTEKIMVDWGHANSLFRDVDNNFLVSFRNLHQIWKINAETGDIMYRFGLDGDIQPEDSDQFYDQHYAHINPRGELMIFDNGGKNLTTRAISFIINEQTKTVEKKLDVPLPKEMFSHKRGSVQLIDNDKLLFCSTTSNNIVVTDLEGKILWNLKIPKNAYRVEYVEGVKF